MENLFTKSACASIACQALIFLLSIGFLQAQSANDWTLQSEKNGVKLYSSTSQCDDKNMLVLKFENTNIESKHVNYSVVVRSTGHNIPLRPKSLELAASETKIGDCETEQDLTGDIKNITSFELQIVMAVN